MKRERDTLGPEPLARTKQIQEYIDRFSAIASGGQIGCRRDAAGNILPGEKQNWPGERTQFSEADFRFRHEIQMIIEEIIGAAPGSGRETQSDSFRKVWTYEEGPNLTVEQNPAGVVITWKGTDPDLPAVILGGHLDTISAPPFEKTATEIPNLGPDREDGQGSIALKLTEFAELYRTGGRPEADLKLLFVTGEETAPLFSGSIAVCQNWTKEMLETVLPCRETLRQRSISWAREFGINGFDPEAMIGQSLLKLNKPPLYIEFHADPTSEIRDRGLEMAPCLTIMGRTSGKIEIRPGESAKPVTPEELGPYTAGMEVVITGQSGHSGATMLMLPQEERWGTVHGEATTVNIRPDPVNFLANLLILFSNHCAWYPGTRFFLYDLATNGSVNVVPEKLSFRVAFSAPNKTLLDEHKNYFDRLWEILWKDSPSALHRNDFALTYPRALVNPISATALSKEAIFQDAANGKLYPSEAALPVLRALEMMLVQNRVAIPLLTHDSFIFDREEDLLTRPFSAQKDYTLITSNFGRIRYSQGGVSLSFESRSFNPKKMEGWLSLVLDSLREARARFLHPESLAESFIPPEYAVEIWPDSTPPAGADPELYRLLRSACAAKLGPETAEMLKKFEYRVQAGQDALRYSQAGWKTIMGFVAANGICHHPDGWVSPADWAAAGRVLNQLLTWLLYPSIEKAPSD